MYESGPWKEDLKRRRQLLLQYNTKEHFEKDEDKAYTVIEKAIFYSAFIIRKLLDCNGKMSDEADQYAIKVTEWKPTRKLQRAPLAQRRRIRLGGRKSKKMSWEIKVCNG